ncbi:hypothetical protein [Paenibacillus caui]|uniref:hypothetical protein n=1 Tax=Paenibacillus caui TaxID=2873927 RepID=UPI001CA9B135|nr:hypothetical protein [Paenibacillus caui]
MKYDAILRFIAAVVLFTFVAFVQDYPWAVTLFTAAGIYAAVTGLSKIMNFGRRRP